jgi:hypothetical protein
MINRVGCAAVIICGVIPLTEPYVRATYTAPGKLQSLLKEVMQNADLTRIQIDKSKLVKPTVGQSHVY